MLVQRTIGLRTFVRWNAPHILWLTVFVGTIGLLYERGIVSIALPWVPISVIGTAVAFYVGFKNNQAYDRMWEARKIWGGIVNDSRAWGMMVDSYISRQFSDREVSDADLNHIKRRLIYRHIGWLYSHRSQLLVTTSWEHASQSGHLGRTAEHYQKTFGIGLVDDELTRTELHQFLPETEFDRLVGAVNTATQIINEQSRDLQDLRSKGLIDDFRHMEMMGVLREFYALQGKNERIKKFPLPRLYSNMSRYFVRIFIAMLPFSMIPELMKVSEWGGWLSVPITVLLAWIYVTMEEIGDYSENPFQGMANDIPMMSLCRIIEIDLRQILGEKELPPGVEAKNGILM